MLGRVSRGRRMGGVGVIVRRQAALGRLLAHKPKRQPPNGHAHFARGMRPIDRRFADPGNDDRGAKINPDPDPKPSPKSKTSSKAKSKPRKSQKPRKRPVPSVSETELKPVEDRSQLQEAYFSARASQSRATQAHSVLPMSAVTIVRKETAPVDQSGTSVPTSTDAGHTESDAKPDDDDKAAKVHVIKINSYRPMVGVDPVTGRSTTLLREKKSTSGVQQEDTADPPQPADEAKLGHLKRMARRQTLAGRRLMVDLGRRTRGVIARRETADPQQEPTAAPSEAKAVPLDHSVPQEPARPESGTGQESAGSLVARLKALESADEKDAVAPKPRPQRRKSRRWMLLRLRVGRAVGGASRRVWAFAIPIAEWSRSRGGALSSALARTGQRRRRQARATVARFRQSARRRRSLGDIPDVSARPTGG